MVCMCVCRSKSPLLKSPRSKSPMPFTSDSPPTSLYIAVSKLPPMSEQVYTPLPGQVFFVEDVSRGEVWRVKVLTGNNAGSSEWVQKNCLEEYCTHISTHSIRKEVHVIHKLSA